MKNQLKNRINNQRGFNIVELMIAITIGLVISGAIGSVFLTSSKTNKAQDNLARLQENVRFALIQMQTDIRMSGYRGCLGQKGNTVATPKTQRAAIDNVITTPSYDNDLGVSMQGYNENGASWLPALDSTISGATPAPATGSDVITVRYASGGVQLSGDMANSASAIPIVANTDNLVAGDAAMIADCVASTIFKVTSATSTAITHTTANNSVAIVGRSYKLDTANVNGTVTDTTDLVGFAFGRDAMVMPIKTVTYYVAPSTGVTNGLSLWRKTNANASEEIIDNIEKLKILYGEDTAGINDKGNNAPAKYVTANQVTNMNNVIAIKLMILARTSDDKLSATGQNYTFKGVTGIVPTDKYLRRAFNTVITIRNRAT